MEDERYFNLSNAVTDAIDSGDLSIDEVREAVEEGISNSSFNDQPHVGGGPKKK
jgi:hypothetical protein